MPYPILSDRLPTILAALGDVVGTASETTGYLLAIPSPPLGTQRDSIAVSIVLRQIDSWLGSPRPGNGRQSPAIRLEANLQSSSSLWLVFTPAPSSSYDDI